MLINANHYQLHTMMKIYCIKLKLDNVFHKHLCFSLAYIISAPDVTKRAFRSIIVESLRGKSDDNSFSVVKSDNSFSVVKSDNSFSVVKSDNSFSVLNLETLALGSFEVQELHA